MPAFGIGKGKRYEQPPTLSPGPGNYFKEKVERVPYSLTQTIKELNCAKVQMKEPEDEKNKKERSKTDRPVKVLPPGPGAYDIPNLSNVAEKYKIFPTMGKKEISRFGPSKIIVCPGPGAYEPKKVVVNLSLIHI